MLLGKQGSISACDVSIVGSKASARVLSLEYRSTDKKNNEMQVMQLKCMLNGQMASPSNSMLMWFSTSDSCTFTSIVARHCCFAGMSLLQHEPQHIH